MINLTIRKDGLQRQMGARGLYSIPCASEPADVLHRATLRNHRKYAVDKWRGWSKRRSAVHRSLTVDNRRDSAKSARQQHEEQT